MALDKSDHVVSQIVEILFHKGVMQHHIAFRTSCPKQFQNCADAKPYRGFARINAETDLEVPSTNLEQAGTTNRFDCHPSDPRSSAQNPR
jgi:hypothetical protein